MLVFLNQCHVRGSYKVARKRKLKGSEFSVARLSLVSRKLSRRSTRPSTGLKRKVFFRQSQSVSSVRLRWLIKSLRPSARLSGVSLRVANVLCHMFKVYGECVILSNVDYYISLAK